MGISNRVQAVLVGVSAGLGAFGTAAAAIPDFVPPEYKVPIAVTAWLAGIVGFSIKEALGGKAPNLKQKHKQKISNYRRIWDALNPNVSFCDQAWFSLSLVEFKSPRTMFAEEDSDLECCLLQKVILCFDGSYIKK